MTTSLPATDMQRLYWLLYEGSEEQRPPPQHIRYVLMLDGAVDVAALEGSIAITCRAHAALRTRFEVEDGALTQTFDAPAPRLALHDLRALPPDERRRAAARAIADAGDRRFHLTDGSAPVRFELVRIGDDEAALACVIHHTVCDLVSLQIVAETICTAYRDIVEGRTASVPTSNFGEYVAFERELRAAPAAEEKRAFWRSFLEGTEVPPPKRKPLTASTTLEVPRLDETLAREARALGVDRSAVVLARFACAIHGWRSDPQAVGYFTSNRRDPRFRQLVGFPAQMVPIRVSADGGAIEAVVQDCQRAFRSTLVNLLPVGEIARAVARPRLFDLVISMAPLPVLKERESPSRARMLELARDVAPGARELFDSVRIGDLEIVQLAFPHGSLAATLGLLLTRNRIQCEFDAGAVDRDEVERILARFADPRAFEVAHGV